MNGILLSGLISLELGEEDEDDEEEEEDPPACIGHPGGGDGAALLPEVLVLLAELTVGTLEALSCDSR